MKAVLFIGYFCAANLNIMEEKELDKSIKTLEYNCILQQLQEIALSTKAKERFMDLRPYLKESECRNRMEETTEAKKILESFGTPPLSSMKDMDKLIEICEMGAMLLPEQFTQIGEFISACKRTKAYLKRAEESGGNIAYYGNSICDLSDLKYQIDQSIRNGRVEDSASKLLRDIRRKMEQINNQVKAKLEGLLKSKKEYFSESYISTRNGHFVLPVKREHKHQISGSVIDMSGTKSTYFIEPDIVGKMQGEHAILAMEEENEVRKVLYTLTALVHQQISEITLNMEAMETLDFVFAKAKLSQTMKAIPVLVDTKGVIEIKKGRHPLLSTKDPVPLDFTMGQGIAGVVITGPNTGGKTVALKTIGLLAMMAQSGLHVPAGEGSHFCMHNAYLCDIGDGQSITENLSTFSAHITNIIGILERGTKESLVLLDELGSGTDPAEGMGIAAAILEELRAKGCLFVATTHYPEIKEYAKKAEGLINARMEFDRESLKPLYQLTLGEAGESCAIYIARQLGMPEKMLSTAYHYAYKEKSKEKLIEFKKNPLPKENILTQAPSIKRVEEQKKSKENPGFTFQIGDSVLLLPGKDIGIVYQKADNKGQVGIQIKKQKQLVSYKRLKLHVAASQLYPPDYDFSILFDSVANRKARHQMDKGHRPDIIIDYEEGSNNGLY